MSCDPRKILCGTSAWLHSLGVENQPAGKCRTLYSRWNYSCTARCTRSLPGQYRKRHIDTTRNSNWSLGRKAQCSCTRRARLSWRNYTTQNSKFRWLDRRQSLRRNLIQALGSAPKARRKENTKLCASSLRWRATIGVVFEGSAKFITCGNN